MSVIEAMYFVILMILLLFLFFHFINAESDVTGVLFFLTVVIFIGFLIPREVEEAKKEASFQCQFEECPYEYDIQNDQDTVLVKKRLLQF